MADSQPDFDWSQAESLLGEDPTQVPQDMADIVVELVEGSRGRFQELAGFDPKTERVKIGAQAHQLRGSLLNFGFTGVGAILFDIEKKEYPPEDYSGMVSASEEAFQASLKMLSERYPTLRLA